MKKNILLFIFMLITWGSLAISPVTKNFVITSGKTYFGEKVNMGPAITKIYNAAGEVTKIPFQMVESYMQDNKVFVKLPVITKANDTIGHAFMQYISSRSGLQLYRYCSKCLNYDPLESIIAPANMVYRYYVFKEGKFFVLLDEINTESYLAFFGVRAIS